MSKRKNVTTAQRVFSALCSQPRIITDTEETILGRGDHTCVLWNNLIGLNYTNATDWQQFKDHQIHEVYGIKREVKQVAIFDGAKLLHKVDISQYPCKVIEHETAHH
jgi:hypothetical protein